MGTLPMWTLVILTAFVGFSRAQRRACRDGSAAYVECDFFSLTCDKKPSLTCEYIDSRFYCCPPVQIGALVATSTSTQSTRTTASTSTKTTTLTRSTSKLSIIRITPPIFTTRRTTLSSRPTTTTVRRAPTSLATESVLHLICRDRSRDCGQVAHLCNDRVYYELMTQTCARTCNFCNVMPCEDAHDRCTFWARNGMCTNEFFKRLRMDIQCPRSCNMCN